MSQHTLNTNVAAHATGEKRRKRAVLYLRVSTPGQVNTETRKAPPSLPSAKPASARPTHWTPSS